jgi:uncharacterized low-complexity protein
MSRTHRLARVACAAAIAAPAMLMSSSAFATTPRATTSATVAVSAQSQNSVRGSDDCARDHSTTTVASTGRLSVGAPIVGSNVGNEREDNHDDGHCAPPPKAVPETKYLVLVPLTAAGMMFWWRRRNLAVS